MRPDLILGALRKVSTTPGSASICRQFREALDTESFPVRLSLLESALYLVFERWPNFSGSRIFPVPCPHGGDAYEAYIAVLDADIQRMDGNLPEWDFWTGQYGDLRKDLLAFLIAHFEGLCPAKV